MATTADPIEVLKSQAAEIEQRIQPQRDAIAADEQMLARLRAAIEVLSGEVTVPSGGASRAQAFRQAATPSGRRPRGSVKEAILSYLASRPGATAAQVAENVGGSKQSVTSSLQKMSDGQDAELEKVQLGGRSVGFKLRS